MKLGRNDRCWCGSGVKFKKCHLGRESQSPVKSWEASAISKKAFAVKFCSAPAAMHADCTGLIVRAHTVPKSGSLAKIAENGHVYAFVPTLEDLIKHDGVLPPKLVGVNGASTFTGFCSKHDNELFAPVEQENFSSRPDQCFLLSYRAYAREVYTKKAAAASAKQHLILDRGKPVIEQIGIQATSAAYGLGLSAALNDIEHHQPRFEAPLLSGDYSAVRAYVISFDAPPPVMCSGSFAPEQDFAGLTLQDLADLSVIPHLISVTSFFGGLHGHVVFVWLPDDDPVCLPFVRSLASIPDSDLSSALVRFMFEFFENVHINPSWWRGLSQAHQEALIRRMAASANPQLERSADCLRPDEWSVSPWAVVKREWIGAHP
ncbi:SEC-C domain-containing protein [Dyella sp. S184]|uniref:SEC-C domain-containing protein n=1 Tax=Dyella sp. S184 TaxID=1641862 RepID=UPI00131EB25A|nr:SEC-C domain-containing protein [Dyella sp. S184]